MSNEWEERRFHEGPRSLDVRTQWDRDYARLIHSAAFRRLQSKTQVLGLGESDFYRTRLTHSMEVAQIGVGILRWLKEKHKNNEEIMQALPDDVLMSSICLAHDIGHPPFGHGGEVALNLCMREYGGFEGNGQTLRILSRLEKYTDGYGLNPTRRLLLGILKYPVSYSVAVVKDGYGIVPSILWQSKAGEQHPPKCYMDDEQIVVNWIFENLEPKEISQFTETERKYDKGIRLHDKPCHKALDTSIMELADDISYSLHDFEDAISLGMVTRKDWDRHNEGREDIFLDCDLDGDSCGDKLFSGESFLRKKEIGNLIHRLIINTEVKLSEISASNCAQIKWNACVGIAHKRLQKHIFELVKEKVIKSSNVQQLEFKGQKIVVELFQVLNSDPERLLPDSTCEKYKTADCESAKARVICDFISGMTDDYATRMYEKLFYPKKGSIFDKA